MRRQDLLDQRRAGAGHADDEDRQAVSRTRPRDQRLPCALERIGGEVLNEVVVSRNQRRAIEAHGHRPQPVGRFVMPHRLRVIAEVVVRLAKAELNVDALLYVEARPIGQAAHAIHQRTVGLCHALHHGQFQKGGRENLGCLGEMARGLLEHAAVRQELPEERARLGSLRRDKRADRELRSPLPSSLPSIFSAWAK